MWLVTAILAIANLQYTLVKLQAAWTGQDKTGQDMGLHITQVLCPQGPHASFQKCTEHAPPAVGGAVQGGLGSFPQPARAPHHGAAGCVPACLPPSSTSPGQE